MAELFSRLFRHGRNQQNEGADILTDYTWINTTPVESSDKPCSLSALDVRANVSGLFAEVTQTLTIENPNERPISVDVCLPMPDRAVVSGYALEMDGQMVDGVVVGKQKARVAFETEQRRRVDPGLVEAVKGNVYRTRVYPIPSKGSRTVRLRSVAPLLLDPTGGATLDLPMPSEPIGRRTLTIEVEMLACPKPEIAGLGNALMSDAQGLWRVEHEDTDVTPTEAVRVSMPRLPDRFATIERDAEGALWFSASQRVGQQESADAPEISQITVLWDVSGSRASLDHVPELKLLEAYCATPSTPGLRLVTFANSVLEEREYGGFSELQEAVETLRYDGGTNYAELTCYLDGADRSSAYLLFTDGIDTLCDEAPAFPADLNVLAVVSGVERDLEAMRQACRGLAFDPSLAPKDAVGLARAFAQGNPSRISGLTGEGLADVCDAGSPAVGRRAIIGRLICEKASVTLAEGSTLALDAGEAREGSTLSSAWAARRVSLLAPRADENADELLALGRRFGVVSPVTSLLVLETLEQWLRHDVEPPKSMKELHEAWEQAVAGRMQISSEEGKKAAHRRQLASEWGSLMRWWERDYSSVDAGGGSGWAFCPRCGQRLAPGSLECPACGFVLPVEPQVDTSVPHGMSVAAESAPNESLFTRAAAAFSRPMMAARGAGMVGAAPMAAAPMEAMRSDEALEDRMPAPATSASAAQSQDSAPTAVVSVRAWMPDAPYLKVLDGASGRDAARDAYFASRGEYRRSPSFFLDCAGWFMAHEDEQFGLRVLSNLAELRIEDAALLRVMGWRLREAGQLGQALVVLRRVLKLRGEDSQSHRDVALTLTELAREELAGKDATAAKAHAEEAGELYRTCALTPWARRPMAMALFAVEEYNVLRAWADAQSWDEPPALPSLGDDLEGVPACDLRVTLAWDADETDVDIHVTEPSGEEAYYGHRNTSSGGRVSEDITDGYGPELYEIRRAREGSYLIRAHYYASHQQTVFGPATCTLTVYTDWGRPEQDQQVTSTRLDKAKEMVEVGTASYGSVVTEEPEQPGSPATRIELDMSLERVRELLGDERQGSEPKEWPQAGGRTLVVEFVDGKVARVVERTAWGDEMVVLQ